MVGGDYCMSYEEPLSKHAIAISISESPNLSVLGLSNEHLVDSMAEVARHLLAMGARLIYGGDLRPGGFTEVLFELISRYRRDADLNDERIGVKNFLPWPVHVSWDADQLRQLSESLKGVAELVFLTVNGEVISLGDRMKLASRAATEDEWFNGLTAMREIVTNLTDARVVFGGKTQGFKGRMPGIAEEALLTLRAGKPLFVLGGFGGCAGDIAHELGLARRSPGAETNWAGSNDFAAFSATSLNNGLDPRENSILASTVHIDQAVTLLLRGLLRKTK